MKCRLALLWMLLVTSCFGSDPRQDWQKFREEYPYHIQTVALSAPVSDGTRTLVISEPPPNLALKDLQSIDPVLQNLTTFEHGVGVDGWVRDAVVELPPTDDKQLSALLDKVNLKLYGTTYKAFAVAIPTGKQGVTKRIPLNLQVSSSDLHTWLIGERPRNFSYPLLIFCLAIYVLAYQSYKKGAYRGVGILGCLIVVVAYKAIWVAIVALWILLFTISIATVRSQKIRRGVLLATVAGVLCVCSHRHWLGSPPTTQFRYVAGTKEVSCREILDRKLSGVFFSTKPGIVMWAMPRADALEHHRREARQFSLDSDLLLGAIASPDQIAIIGRERVSPVSLLPPLRIETILQLGAAREDELAQSYERTNPFAGRFEWAPLLKAIFRMRFDDLPEYPDWAPIYLSQRLVDTEYGSLLNITDQMLKSWSEHGQVRYINFKYPDPPKFPFEKALDEDLNAREITFNWNTKGAGYVTSIDDYEMMALSRTGALGVDYLAGDRPKVEEAENVAYQYFSALGDPNLVRVVEYAALYQIFHHFGIHSSLADPPSKPFSSPLLTPAKYLIDGIAKLSNEDLERLQIQMHADAESTEVLQALGKAVTDLRNIPIGNKERGTLAKAIIDRHELIALVRSGDQEQQELATTATAISRCAELFLDSEVRTRLMLESIEWAEHRKSDWIHTPSVVISHGRSEKFVGGHNLYSRVPEYRADSAIEVGRVAVSDESGQRVIRFNPVDESKIAGTVRDEGRSVEKSASDAQEILNSRLSQVSRPTTEIDEGLGFDNVQPGFDKVRPEELRGLQPAHIDTAIKNVGWAPERSGSLTSKEKTALSLLTDARNTAILVSRTDNGYSVLGPSGLHLQASTIPSATDAMITAIAQNKMRGVVNVEFSGFQAEQAEGFLRGAENYVQDDVSLIATTRDELTQEEIAAIKKGEYRLDRADIESVNSVVEEGKEAAIVDLKLKHEPGRLRDIFIRIKLVFREITGNLTSRVAELRAQISGMLQSFNSETDLRIAVTGLAKELRKDPRYTGVSINVRRENKDLFYVHNRNEILSRKVTDLAV